MEISTFLDWFKKSDEPFIMHQGILHTLHQARHDMDDNYFLFCGTKYEISESEDIKTLQDEFIDENSGKIEEFLTDYVKKHYVDRFKRIRADISEKCNLFDSIRNSSVERFIVSDVFDEYCGLYSLENKQRINQNVRPADDEVLLPEISFSDINLDGVLEMMAKKSVIVLAQRVYGIEQASRKPKNYIVMKGKKYKIRGSQGLDALINLYNNSLRQAVIDSAVKISPECLRVIDSYADIRKDLDSMIDDERIVHGLKHSRRRSDLTHSTIGFAFRGEEGHKKLYDVCLEIDPYILKKNNNYYRFDKVKVGTTLSLSHGRIKLNDKAKIIGVHYNHPFVYADNTICYNGDGRLREEGVDFRFYDVGRLRQDGFASNVAVALNVAKKVLEEGYRGYSIIPVNILKPEKFPGEYLRGGRREAIGLGIRIIDNDDRME